MNFSLYRHPKHSSRPSFLEIVKTLSAQSDDLLKWVEGDTKGLDEQALLLGAPLDVSRNMFPELRSIYT